MRFKKWTAALMCAALSSGALAACGDDEESAGGGNASTSAAPPAEDKTPKGDPIVVGAICSCSGAQAAVLSEIKEVNEAWAKSVNAKGGINGHPVKMIVKDDAGEPAKALAAAKELVEKDKVVAFVGMFSLAEAAWEKYVSGKGIPVVGGLSISPPFLSNPDWFPSGSNQVTATFGTMQSAKDAGKKSVGVLYCAESPVCAQLDPLAKGAAQVVGGLAYKSGKVSGSAPNYTAPCLSMKSAGVDALYAASNSSVVQRLINDCAKQGYKPLSIGSINTVGSDWFDNPNLEGAVSVSSNANYTDESVPGVKEYMDAIDQYVPGLREKDGYGSNYLQPWAGGKLFEAAAEAGKFTPKSTPEDIKAGLYQLKDETLDGLMSPTTFTKGKPTFVPCYFGTKIEGGKLVSTDGGKPKCLTPEQVKTLTAGLS